MKFEPQILMRKTLDFKDHQKHVSNNKAEGVMQRAPKSAKIHPLAKKCCGWEKPSVWYSKSILWIIFGSWKVLAGVFQAVVVKLQVQGPKLEL